VIKRENMPPKTPKPPKPHHAPPAPHAPLHPPRPPHERERRERHGRPTFIKKLDMYVAIGSASVIAPLFFLVTLYFGIPTSGGVPASVALWVGIVGIVYEILRRKPF
jgi:hypothetical protein